MADNLPRVEITDAWLDLNVETGLAVGTNLKIENVSPGAVDIAVFTGTPIGDVGESLEMFQFVAVGDGETGSVWAKTSAKGGESKLSVQDNS